MIEPEFLYDILLQEGVEYYAGVPDSLLKQFCSFVSCRVPEENHVIAANEGAAAGLAVGYHLATGQVPAIYLQNSGFGNVINPVLSIADKEVYGTPMIVIMGWRGQPGVKDEPQHIKQGRVTEAMLKSMEIPYSVINSDTTGQELTAIVQDLIGMAKSTNQPVVLLVEKNTFASFPFESVDEGSLLGLTMHREEAISIIVEGIGDSPVISTTGMASRELFEIRERNKQAHHQDFLTVGAMGHTCQIALGVAGQHLDRQVVCIDGDGSIIMHMGSLAIIGSRKQKNLIHFIINNGVHDSVGGQPTVGFDIDLCAIARACGYPVVDSVSDAEQLREVVKCVDSIQGPALIEVRVLKGARTDLGRPTSSPQQNKESFMHYVGV